MLADTEFKNKRTMSTTKGDSTNSDKSKNEKIKGFVMSPPTEWIDPLLCWPRWQNVRGHGIQTTKRPSPWYRNLWLFHSIRIFDDPSHWMATFSRSEKNDRTVDAGVRTSAGGHASRKSLMSGRICTYKLHKKKQNKRYIRARVIRARMPRAREFGWALLLNG